MDVCGVWVWVFDIIFGIVGVFDEWNVERWWSMFGKKRCVVLFGRIGSDCWIVCGLGSWEGV